MGFWKVYQLHTGELVNEEEKLLKVRHQAHGWHLEHPEKRNNGSVVSTSPPVNRPGLLVVFEGPARAKWAKTLLYSPTRQQGTRSDQGLHALPSHGNHKKGWYYVWKKNNQKAMLVWAWPEPCHAVTISQSKVEQTSGFHWKVINVPICTPKRNRMIVNKCN